MGTNSRIEWCDHSWNPWYCCTRVSEGCANCYMERWAKRAGRDAFGGPIPAKNRMHFPRSKKHNIGDFVFVCSLSDFFHDDAPDQWRADALAAMSQRPELVFLLLTKRIDVAKRFLEEEVKARIPEAWEILERERNVWLGVTAENQIRADQRIPVLIEMEWPGKKFVSIEPMIGPVSVAQWLHEKGGGFFPIGLPKRQPALPANWHQDKLDWVIVGGESGANARPMHPAWARTVRDQCKSAGVPFFFKQWGEYMPAVADLDADECGYHCKNTYIDDDGRDLTDFDDWYDRYTTAMWRVGKKQAGKLLDGVEHLERPSVE